MRRHLLAAVPLALLAVPALADETTGTIIAYDRVAKVIVMEDRTVFQLSDKTELSADLVAGDKVRIVYAGAGDSGIGAVQSVIRTDG